GGVGPVVEVPAALLAPPVPGDGVGGGADGGQAHASSSAARGLRPYAVAVAHCARAVMTSRRALISSVMMPSTPRSRRRSIAAGALTVQTGTRRAGGGAGARNAPGARGVRPPRRGGG